MLLHPAQLRDRQIGRAMALYPPGAGATLDGRLARARTRDVPLGVRRSLQRARRRTRDATWRRQQDAPADQAVTGEMRSRNDEPLARNALAFVTAEEASIDAFLSVRRGRHGRARADFREYQGLEHSPEWWELAYAEDGALAGVSMAARNPSKAVVAYVGVVPEQRGRRLAVQLVRRCTEQLLASGAAEIGGDCDRDNVAMVKAFERAGFETVARRRSYRRDLRRVASSR